MSQPTPHYVGGQPAPQPNTYFGADGQHHPTAADIEGAVDGWDALGADTPED